MKPNYFNQIGIEMKVTAKKRLELVVENLKKGGVSDREIKSALKSLVKENAENLTKATFNVTGNLKPRFINRFTEEQLKGTYSGFRSDLTIDYVSVSENDFEAEGTILLANFDNDYYSEDDFEYAVKSIFDDYASAKGWYNISVNNVTIE